MNDTHDPRASEIQEACDALDELYAGILDRPHLKEHADTLAHFLQDLRDAPLPEEPENPVANAILQLASGVSDIGPALRELASATDHTVQLASVAEALDDLSQNVQRATAE